MIPPKPLETVCIAVNGSTERKVGDNVIDFQDPYRRLPILDAIKEKLVSDCSKSEEEFALSVWRRAWKSMKQWVGQLID